MYGLQNRSGIIIQCHESFAKIIWKQTINGNGFNLKCGNGLNLWVFFFFFSFWPVSVLNTIAWVSGTIQIVFFPSFFYFRSESIMNLISFLKSYHKLIATPPPTPTTGHICKHCYIWGVFQPGRRKIYSVTDLMVITFSCPGGFSLFYEKFQIT